MGTRGPRSKDGRNGYSTAKGYRRIYHGGRLRMEHVVVWEQHHGPVPDGHQIHHIDHNKLNNDISNLEAVDSVTHKRIHSGCQLRDGIWWKPCGVCGEFKPVVAEHWYLSAEGWPCYGRCRPCHIARVVADKRARNDRRAAQRLP